MSIPEYLIKAIQDDVVRVGERDRLLREARRARKARRQRLVPGLAGRDAEGSGGAAQDGRALFWGRSSPLI